MQSSRSSFLALSLCLPLAACPGDGGGNANSETSAPNDSSGAPGPSTQTTTGMPSVQEESTAATPPPDTTSTTAMGTTEGPGTSGTTEPGFFFDLGEIPEAPLLDDECGNIDFMFVIDNSGSMGDEQANLVANFPAFIDGIQVALESVDSVQVGVITTDAYSANIAGCQNLSSLVVQTNSMVCGPYADGSNFMNEADDLGTAFNCAALVGTSGSASERPMQAMVEAALQVDGGPGQCNEGFIREDALLVIVIITDESDSNSTGIPMTWYDDVLAAKDGIPENVVVMSLINTPGGACGFDVATDMATFTTMWGVNGFLADICSVDYAPIFQEAIGVIDVACDNYIPPA